MINEAFGWLWIVGGFLTGGLLGIGFDRETFLGGYASWARRLLRLGHIAMIALGVLNILFAQSVVRSGLDPAWNSLGSWSLITGAVLMPGACALCAFRPKAKPVFALPVVALTLGASIIGVGLVIGGMS